MPAWICAECGKGFSRCRSGARPIRFCSYACYNEWRKGEPPNAGTIKLGNKPWNKGMKGIHLSPSTEFKKGRKSTRLEDIGSIKIRSRSREPGQRAYVKVANPRTWLLRCRFVWESFHGPIPRGLIIHHIDGNTLNDDLCNLSLVDRAAHARIHGLIRRGLNKKRGKG